MRKVQFPLVKNGNLVVYPDDISLFRNTEINGDMVVGYYSGAMPLDDYVELEPDHIIITHLAFRRLFQLNERIAFDNFEENSVLTAEQKQTLRTISKDFEMAQEIDLKDPDVIGGLQFIESCGILGGGRSAEVLAYRP